MSSYSGWIRLNKEERELMKLTEQEVAHVANLAKLSLTEEEMTNMLEKLSDIITKVDLLAEVDTEGIEPTVTLAEEVNIMRQDIAEDGTDRTLLFKNVPESTDGYIKVPAILEDGGDA